MLTSRQLLGYWLVAAGDNALYAVVWTHLIGWGHPTYYNRCYTIEGHGHYSYMVDTKTETIKQGPYKQGTCLPPLWKVYAKFQKHRPVYKLHNSTIVTISIKLD